MAFAAAVARMTSPIVIDVLPSYCRSHVFFANGTELSNTGFPGWPELGRSEDAVYRDAPSRCGGGAGDVSGGQRPVALDKAVIYTPTVYTRVVYTRADYTAPDCTEVGQTEVDTRPGCGTTGHGYTGGDTTTTGSGSVGAGGMRVVVRV